MRKHACDVAHSLHVVTEIPVQYGDPAPGLAAISPLCGRAAWAASASWIVKIPLSVPLPQ